MFILTNSTLILLTNNEEVHCHVTELKKTQLIDLNVDLAISIDHSDQYVSFDVTSNISPMIYRQYSSDICFHMQRSQTG